MKRNSSNSQFDPNKMEQESRFGRERYDLERTHSNQYRITTPKAKNEALTYPEQQLVKTRESLPAIERNPQDFLSEDSGDAMFAERCRHSRYYAEQSRDDDDELMVFSADEIHGQEDRYSSAPDLDRIWTTSTDASTHILRRQEQITRLETINEPTDSLLALSSDDIDVIHILGKVDEEKQESIAKDESPTLRVMETLPPNPQPTPVWRRVPSILPVQTELQHIELHEKVPAQTGSLLNDEDVDYWNEGQRSSVHSTADESGRRPFRFLRWKKKSSPEDISEEPSDLQLSKSSSCFSGGETEEEWDNAGLEGSDTLAQESLTLTRESAIDTEASKEMVFVPRSRMDMLCANVVSFEEQNAKKKFRFFRRKKKVAINAKGAASVSVEEESSEEDLVSKSFASSAKENADVAATLGKDITLEETINDKMPNDEDPAIDTAAIGSFCPSPINLASPSTRQKLGLFLVDQTTDGYVSPTAAQFFVSPPVSPQHVAVTEEEKDAMYTKCLMSEDSEASTRGTAQEMELSNFIENTDDARASDNIDEDKNATAEQVENANTEFVEKANAEQVDKVNAQQVEEANTKQVPNAENTPKEEAIKEVISFPENSDEVDHEPEIGQCMFFYNCGPSRFVMNCSRPRTTIECGENVGNRVQPCQHPTMTNHQQVATIADKNDEKLDEVAVSDDDYRQENHPLLETYELAPVPSKTLDVDANDENIEITRKPKGTYKVYTNTFADTVSITTIEIPGVADADEDNDRDDSGNRQVKKNWFGRTKNNVDSEKADDDDQPKKRSIRDIITQFRKIHYNE